MAYGLPYMRIVPNTDPPVQEWYDANGVQITEAEAIAITADIMASNPNPTTMAVESRNLLKTVVANNLKYINNPSPTNAESIAQIKALSRQLNALVRLVQG